MTQNLSENKWFKGTAIAVLTIAFFGVWAYLAGGIFLMIFHRKFEEATPLTVYQYWVYYGKNQDVIKWLSVAVGVALAALLSPAMFFLSPSKRSLFGDARYAKTSEIRKAGLLGTKGIIVGIYMKSYLMFGGSQHVILSAPTRSGKGVSFVIPNLLNWPDSAVVLDVKQENWSFTSAYRKKYGQECYLFNPVATDYRSHRYNPLGYISEDPNFRIDDVQKIGNMLFPDQPGTDVIWTATPRGLFLGVVLYLIETPGKLVTLGQVLRESLADGDGSAYFAKIINERAKTKSALSGACVRALNGYISIASENTRAGVMTSFRSRLELWMNPLVDAATSANDFDLREIRKKRMSIYIGVTPDNLERMAPLINLFFQQLLDLNTRELPIKNKALKYACLLLMDEFTAIGKINILSKGISYIAGYGLRMMPIIQSPAQLVEVYGKDAAQTFTTNHALNIIFPPKASETQTAKDISEWLGYQTVKGSSTSKPKGLFAKNKQGSESESDQRRAMLLPQEITSLGTKKQLVIMENVPPILAEKAVFYKDAVFIDRLKEVSKSLRQLGAKLPTQEQLDAAVSAGELGAKVPFIDIEAHYLITGASDQPLTVAAPSNAGGGTHSVTVERDFTADDMPNLAKMTLDNFAIDFSGIEPPTGDIDRAALEAYADQLCKQAGIEI